MPSYFSAEIAYGDVLLSYANSFREIAFEIDDDPNSILNYIELPAINFILSDRDSTTVQRTQYLEALAYGDPGVLLACPGPSLSGLMMRELGLPEQIDQFYRILQSKKMRTFFALTEPKKGSDANNIETRIIKSSRDSDRYLLRGEKCFFGNGAVGDMGVVLARMYDGLVGIRAIWLLPECIENNATIETLPMFSLHGAQIAKMKFNNTLISKSNILGNHLSICENGLLGITKVLNRLRSGVGAIAIGQAQAAFDLTFSINKKRHLSNKSIFSNLNDMLFSARKSLQRAAIIVDENALNSSEVSLAKANATFVSESVINACIDLCTLDQLLENPWLLKAYRDVFSWEFMEGTTDMQKKKIIKEII
ncbi:MAG: acyl-CoA/acyl-ACP dehydrogenase [Gammaproteobacteria bacterium]|nr:acyl-CoA/acyl-ACP dehydrogenase [Gammaproteobacteria bacterium]